MAPFLGNSDTPLSSSSATSESGDSGIPEQVAGSEPIAICGLACRLPGDVYSGPDLWDLLVKGRSAQCDAPSSRFNIDGFYHPRGADRPGSMNVKGGYFLKDDIRLFENDFFGINNMEATFMDPQQRKLLEVVFECFESAGVPLEQASGSNTGCYVGNFTVDFQVMQNRDPEYFHRYSATGMGTTILGNRVSHAFNLTGPSLVIDTACSSSLYCLHMACVALETGECNAAIVAGANLIQSAEQHLGTMKAGVLSATSTCHTFDASADGYGRGDGIGALYLKRLSDARRDGDPIRAVIRGTAINANGKTPGITLPSATGQEAVIRKAYAKAALPLKDTAYVECHGTGTPVGDPIEVEAVSRSFSGLDRDPLLIGSIKTNVGHSEAASGISSVIKVALALEKSFIPPSYGVKKLNPKIKTDEWRVSVVTEGRSWPGQSNLRRAGVNSFGYGGANAHAIIESADSFGRAFDAPIAAIPHRRQTYLLPFSASTDSSLEARVNRMSKYTLGNFSMPDVLYTLITRRSQLSKKGFVIAQERAFHDDMNATSLQTVKQPLGNLPYAFIFTGQGAQWATMGRELLDEFSVFDDAFAQMDAILQELPHPPTWTLKDTLRQPASTSKINEVTHSQPICTALQIGLIHLLASWGIQASAVTGHSSGEIACAYSTGHLTMRQAIAAAYYRGYVVGKSSKLAGAMMAAGVSRDTGEELISSLGLTSQARVACINSPSSITISGDEEAVIKIQKTLEEEKTFARKLKTGGTAYHSHHMLELGDEYQSLLEPIFNTPCKSTRLHSAAQFVSSVTGLARNRDFGPAYWRSNLENPVEFTKAVSRLSEIDSYHLIELGPHSALEMPIKQILSSLDIVETKMPYSAAVIRGKDSVRSVLTLAGKLHLHGAEISLLKVNGLTPEPGKAASMTQYRVAHDLPPYQWTYDSLLWHEPRSSIEFRHRKYPRHEFLGSRVPGCLEAEGAWRNILKVDDVSWLSDHKLQESVVFPGAGYLAMAIEAILQTKGLRPTDVGHSVHLKGVNIIKALMLQTDATASVELFTTLRPKAISNVSASDDWYEFHIMSLANGTSTTHASGLIATDLKQQSMQIQYAAPAGTLEGITKRTWYDRLIQEGLNFGPNFQSIEEFQVPRMKSFQHCTASVPLLQCSDGDEVPSYAVHPITIDAMLQTAIIATASGNTTALRAKIPTRIGSLTIRIPQVEADASYAINAKSEVMGFGSSSIRAELFDQHGTVHAQMSDVRLAPYEAAAQVSTKETRHPILRILWKPDIQGLGLMRSSDMQKFVDGFAAESRSAVRDEGLLKLGAALTLAAHKNPRCRILELGNDNNDLTQATMKLLFAHHDFKRLRSYTAASIVDGKLHGSTVDLASFERGPIAKLEGETFDMVLLPNVASSDGYLEQHAGLLNSLIGENGSILAISTKSESTGLSLPGLETVECKLTSTAGRIVFGHQRSTKMATTSSNQKSLVIVQKRSNVLAEALQDVLAATFQLPVSRVTLGDVLADTIPQGATVVSTLETEEPFLSTTSLDDMGRMKTLTNRASSIVWVTAGDLMCGKNPEYALASGLARAIMLEQPSLSFYNYDVDSITEDPQRTASLISSVLRQAEGFVDYEFIQKNGVAHVSRFIADDKLNHTFRTQQGWENELMTLRDAAPVQIGIDTPGQFDTIFFKQIQNPAELQPSEVQVQTKALGLNAKDFYALGGKVDTPDATCSLEWCGIVEKVGSDVKSVRAGDRVVVMAPGRFKSTEVVPEWAVKKLQDEEDFNTMSTLSVVYATALYALRDLARIQPGESVLIHSAAGGVGIAAIQVAKMMGAEVFGTVSSPDKVEYLQKTFGIPASNLFSSRDKSFVDDVFTATGGKGVDVVLNSLTGELLHASWQCCAAFGRFIEIGKRDLTDSGLLNMEQFLKNVTFSAFDLSNMYNSKYDVHHEKWSSLMSDVLDLYRSKKIAKIDPVQVFNISDISKALRRFGSRNRMGKIVINLENEDSYLNVRPFKHRTKFSPTKSYLLIGCLGGIGRSISKWMMARGARNFVFLGRSGTDKASARNLVEELQGMGANVRVVRGDVTRMVDVQAVVDAADSPIGGVIQAAMGLNEAIFSAMSNEYWHTGIDPKVTGTWNLHNAIKGKDQSLDFFLMTSSVSGSVGTATESNYCSANGFLDSFARYRRGLGLPAIAVGLGMISEVGYLHENPDIEALLLRKGILPINEDELIQIMDAALSSGLNISHAYDQSAEAHILTGLEPLGVLELRKKGFEVTNLTLDDPRASILASALGDEKEDLSGQHGSLPVEVTSDLQEGLSLAEAVAKHINKKFCDLILLPPSKVDATKPLASYGLDSMIAAEFRTWFFKAFKVDIPFLELLSDSVALEGLSATVVREIEGRGA